MKKRSLFLLLIMASCHNPASEKIFIRSSNDSAPSNNTFSYMINDSLNLVSSKKLQTKISALLGEWFLTKFLMIDKKSDTTQILQSNITIEFIDKTKMISHNGDITAECTWDYNNISNTFTTVATKLNGNDLESKIIQKNKIIYLSRNKLIYLYEDPVTESTLEMFYKK